MPLYPSFATKEDLANYLNITQEELPNDIERMLSRASELIAQLIERNFSFLNANHLEAAKLATCAQVEYWLTLGEKIAITEGALKNLNAGEIMLEVNEKIPTLSKRAKLYLNQQGLLYAGLDKKQVVL